MKRRLISVGVLLALCLSLCACNTTSNNTHLKGKKTEYSQTIAHADKAWGGVQMVGSEEMHTLKNQTAQIEFDKNTDGLYALSSLQTGETILQNTFTTHLTATNGTVGQITGGTERTHQGNYGVSHSRTDSALRFPGSADKSDLLKEFDLTESEIKTSFSVLKHDVTIDNDGTGLKVSSKGKIRSQFGARSLNLDLGTADRYYLSITLKTQEISGLKCYFSTSEIPLTEDTLLGTLPLENTQEEFVTLTAEIKNELWSGTLQTLLFRFPEGETGSVEISRIAILKGNDPLMENIADTRWTVYADRIYFAQSLNVKNTDYTAASTVISIPKAKCKEMIQTESAVALKLIDGSVLGFVRPTAGGTLSVTETNKEIQLILNWDLSQATPSVALRIYLNYTQDLSELNQIAEQERAPLSSEDFTLTGATFEGYDVKSGIYRFQPTEDKVTVSLKKNNRTVYLYLPPAENTGWGILDQKGNRLPIFVGTTFPLCADGKNLTVHLVPEQKTEEAQHPSFLSDAGLLEQSHFTSVLNGLCTQSTTVYDSPDGDYSVSLTTTRLKDGKATVYDVEYLFHTRTQVSEFRTIFPLFSFDAGFEFDEYFYLNGEHQTTTVSPGDEEFSYLGSMPYVGLISDETSAGWIVTQGQMTTNGLPSTALLCLRYEEPNHLYLSFDQEKIAFVKGDTLTAQVIRWEGTSADEEALKTLRNNGNFRLIQTENKEIKTLTATGMEETVIVQIEGFDRYTFPKITAKGEKFTPEYHHVYVDQDGYYGFAFSVANGTKLEIKN